MLHLFSVSSTRLRMSSRQDGSTSSSGICQSSSVCSITIIMQEQTDMLTKITVWISELQMSLMVFFIFHIFAHLNSKSDRFGCKQVCGCLQVICFYTHWELTTNLKTFQLTGYFSITFFYNANLRQKVIGPLLPAYNRYLAHRSLCSISGAMKRLFLQKKKKKRVLKL